MEGPPNDDPAFLLERVNEMDAEINSLKRKIQIMMQFIQQMEPKIVNVSGDYIDMHDCNVTINTTSTPEYSSSSLNEELSQDSSVSPDFQPDTSFFTSRFPEETTKKKIREVIDLASSKADACRRIMALETQGYIILSNVSDDRKAELINPYAQPKFTLTGEDFKKARNNPHKKK